MINPEDAWMPLADACPPAPDLSVVHLALDLAVDEAPLDPAKPVAPAKATVRLRGHASQPTYLVVWQTGVGKPRALDGLGPNSWAKATIDVPAVGTFTAGPKLDDVVYALISTAYPPDALPVAGVALGQPATALTSADPNVACWAGPAGEPLVVTLTVARPR
jgi:hypothetical protein